MLTSVHTEGMQPRPVFFYRFDCFPLFTRHNFCEIYSRHEMLSKPLLRCGISC